MKFRNRRFAVLSVMVCLLAAAGAQAGFESPARPQKPSPCPKVRVSCPDSVTKTDKLTYTVLVTGGDPDVTPTFNWAISAGAIESGQGTATIEVNTKEVEVDSTITATVELGGYNRDCSTVSSCTTAIIKK